MVVDAGTLAEAQVANKNGGERTPGVPSTPFERVWEQCRPRVWRLVARLAGDRDAADDLTQEVGLRAFQAFARFRHDSSAFTWLYRIAVNVVLRHRERRRPESMPLDGPEAATAPAEEGLGPENALLREELRCRVRAALDRLPTDLRTTLVLQLYEGLKYREVADVLEIPIGTVKSRLHAAMQRLKEELNDRDL